MADNDEYDYENDDNGGTKSNEGGKGLRAQLEAALASVKELREQNEKLAAEGRQRAVADVITSKGLNPKVAALIPATVGSDQSAIESWLTEFGDVFGAPSASTTEDSEDGDEIDPEVREAHERAANATAGSMTEARLASVETQLKNAKTSEEVDQILANARLAS